MPPHPRRIVAALAIAFLMAACAPRDDSAGNADATHEAPRVSASQGLLDDYQQRASALAAQVRAGAVDDAVTTGLTGLMEQGAALVPLFVERHPHCAEYLEAALAVRVRWPELDAGTIEHEYHEDAALPTAGITPACYHMKDLIVHPATALVLLSAPEPDAQQAAREIDEVLAHLSVVRHALQ
jgi:hypothetical protein